MNYWQHALVAFVLAGGTALLVSTPLTPQLAAIIILGGLLPDIDHHKTKQFQVLAAIVGVSAFFVFKNFFEKIFSDKITVAGAAVLAAMAAVVLLYLLKPRHRGITHSLAAAIVFGIIIYGLTQSLNNSIIGGIAYCSHLLADFEFKLI